MYMHDPFTWSSHVRRASLRWPWGRMRGRRRLAAIERDLTADEPVLAAKFAVFGQLGDGEPPAGAERVPPPAWSRSVRLAVLFILAAIVALCVTLSIQLNSVTRPCPAAAAAKASGGHGPGARPGPARVPYC